MDATISDAAIVRSTHRHRPWRCITVCFSVILHAGVLAAALSRLASELPQTEPDALTVALVVESASGSTAGIDASGTGDSAAGSGEPMPAADAGQAAESVAKETRAAEKSPSPAVVQPSPRRPPRNAVSPHAPVQPPPQQPQTASESPAPSPVPMPPSPAAAPVPAVWADPSLKDQRAVQGAATGADGPVVASLGDVGAAAGSAATGGDRGGGDGTGSGPGSGSRGGSGPGFSLGSAGNPMPPYPASARRRGIEGTVVLRVEVSAAGRALSVEIARSSGSDALDAAARDTIARWRFRPATRGGEAIATTTSVPVRFSLLEP